LRRLLPSSSTPSEQLAREEYLRVQASVVGLFLFQGARLSVARRIVVERHHGTINVVSRPGDTRFRVYLPPESRMNARRALEHLLGAKTSTIAPLTETIRAPPGSRLNRRLPH
jgi:hypothetical protein